VSPRSRGKNTPLKIYQYLRSGKPIVATNLLTHTQVLDAAVAELTGPTPKPLAPASSACFATASTPQRSAARPARSLTRATTYEAYVGRTREALRPNRRAHAGSRGAVSDEHYSYRLYADPAMADRFDAMRFSGPIGTLLAESQDRVIASFLGPLEGRAVLDVGTALGARQSASRGAGPASPASTPPPRCCEWPNPARPRPASTPPSRWETHTGWRSPTARSMPPSASGCSCTRQTGGSACRSLCRVADERVVFDYPAAFSAAALQAFGRRLAAAAGRPVEAYRVLRSSAVTRALADAGFRIERVHRQFVLPIALHKALGSRAFTVAVEKALAAVGLLRLMGSPVTVVAVRCVR